MYLVPQKVGRKEKMWTMAYVSKITKSNACRDYFVENMGKMYTNVRRIFSFPFYHLAIEAV